MKRQSKNDKGFTLLEILIVLTLIAVVIGISLPRFKGMRDESNISKSAAECRTLQAAVESYQVHQKKLPSQGSTPLTVWQSTMTAVTPQILSATLNDPFNPGVQYQYATDSAINSKYYVIFSVGPNGTAEITGISTSGVVQGTLVDDIYMSNGTTPSGGF